VTPVPPLATDKAEVNESDAPVIFPVTTNVPEK
jgi:hypothetical protein